VTLRPLVIVLLVVHCGGGGAAPDGGDAAPGVDAPPLSSLPECGGALARVTARTADGRATIAAVDLSPPGQCRIVSGCMPNGGAGGPCAEVVIGNDGVATRCTITFRSTDGRAVTLTATVKTVPGTEYRCRNGPDTSYTAYQVAFDPPTLTVDFAADGGVVDGAP
jgi:hypothetical protein